MPGSEWGRPGRSGRPRARRTGWRARDFGPKTLFSHASGVLPDPGIAARKTGGIGDVFSVCRPVTPDRGCLRCNELIPAWKLQEEIHTAEQRRQQRYVDDGDVIGPSVITLNAITAAHAVNDFLFHITDLTYVDASTDYRRFLARARDVRFEEPQADSACLDSGLNAMSRLGRGDSVELPTKERRRVRYRSLNLLRRFFPTRSEPNPQAASKRRKVS